MRKREKKCSFVTIGEGDGTLEFRREKLDKFPIAGVLSERLELRLEREMRQNRMRIFHTVIIASVCCMVLAGCGHKTPIVYVPDNEKTQQAK